MLDLQPLGTSRFFLEPKMLVFENNMLPRLQGGTLSSAMLQLHRGQGFGIGTCYKTVSDRGSERLFFFLLMLFIPFFCKTNILKLFLLFWLLMISFGWCFCNDFLTPSPQKKKESLNLLYLLSTFRTFLDEMLRSIFVGMQAGWTNPLNSFRGLVLAAKGRQQETERLAYLKNMFMIGSDFWRDSSEVSISTSWCLDSMFLNPRLLYIKGLGFPQQKVWIKHNPSINC